MQAISQKRERKTKGRYHIAVFFINHQQVQGKPYYFWSNISQDRTGSSISRLKGLVTGRWKNKVAWSGLYEDQKQIAEFRYTTNQWNSL